MIQGLSRLCAAPCRGSVVGVVMLASRLPAIVHCNTIASAEASEIWQVGNSPRTASSLDDAAVKTPQVLINRNRTNRISAPTVEVAMMLPQESASGGRPSALHSQPPT